jgi:uncharacterized HAD superfamily protein
MSNNGGTHPAEAVIDEAAILSPVRVIPMEEHKTTKRLPRPFIAVDIDDVIASYVAGMVREYGWPRSFERSYKDQSILNTEWPMLDTVEHFATDNHIEFCSNLLPVPGARDVLHAFLQYGLAIAYVSSRPADHYRMTQAWLSQWMFPTAPIYCAGSKAGKMMTYDNLDVSLIIDDDPRIILDAREEGYTTFVYDRPWNRDVPGMFRVLDWTHASIVMDMLFDI